MKVLFVCPPRMQILRGFKLYLLIFSATFTLLCLILPKETFAAVRCETQYGGREVCVTTGQLQIDKEIFDPINNKFVDNLGINDHRFVPGELVVFKIKVKNVGDAKIDKVQVSDIPQANFFELATGSLNFDLTDLKVGETQEGEIKLRVVAQDKLPPNIICVINGAEAVSGNERDKDTTQLCLEIKVLGVEKGAPPQEMPETGAETWLIFLGGTAGAVIGFRLTRYGAIKSFASCYHITEKRALKKAETS